MNNQYRLTLDVPIQFAVERGMNITRHCSDFSAGIASNGGCYRCPLTGVVMLQPSTLTDAWTRGLQPLGNFRVQDDVQYWNTAKRADAAEFLTNSRNPTDPSISNLLSIYDLTILNALDAEDIMVWAAQSQFLLDQDESFTIHYNSISDNFTRKNNWFCVQWDNIGVHFSQTGLVRVYKFDRSDLTAAPTQIDEFQIASPSELHGKDGFFWFLPIPGIGLVIQHSSTPQQAMLRASSSQQTTTRGHLVPWPYFTAGGINRMFESSVLSIAIHPLKFYMLGIERVTFSTSGTYLDAPLAPDYQPSLSPSTTPTVLLTLEQNVSTSLLNQDGTGAWTLGTDIGGRVLSTLATDDNKHTPFLFGYDVNFQPLLATRDTTPYSITSKTIAGVGRITELDYTEDEGGTFEGTVHLDVTDANIIAICERGDASFLLEISSDNGVTWFVVNGGLAKNFRNEYRSDNGGFLLQSSFSIHCMREHLRETHALRTGALDGKTMAAAINIILTCSGFAAITSFPTDVNNKVIPQPTDGKGFRWESREGEDCSDYLDVMMLFLRSQNVEYRARFDWPTFAWVIELKPRDIVNFWTLSPSSADVDVSARTWRYQRASFEVEPPEGNVVMLQGNSTRGGTVVSTIGDTVNIRVGPMKNFDSISNPSSPDYLGREKTIVYDCSPLADTPEMQRFLLRIFAVVSKHHGLVRDCVLQTAQPLITPATMVRFQKQSGVALADVWVKRRTTKMHDTISSMTLEMDTVWEGPIPRS